MRKAAVVTLGCKVNQFESSSLAESLKSAGYQVMDKPLGVDLVVLNTCTVTQKADHEALSLVRRLKRFNPTAQIVATGCLAQSNPDLLADTGLVTLVLGQDEKSHLVQHLKNIDSPEDNIVKVSSLNNTLAADFGAPNPEKTRAFYKIQDGCSAFCAYCAVPLSRGPSRSLNLDTALEGIRSYMNRGMTEVVICGIHLGQWGRDLNPSLTLADLLHTIDAELSPDEETFRLRLSSIEPLELDNDILVAYEMYPWLAPHFHLPLQSGSNRILEIMGRPYRSEQFTAIVEQVSRNWPLAAIGIDIMAGFPGETDDDFQTTYDLLESLPVSYFHVFPYSKRPGTKAAESEHQIPEHIKRSRVMKLKELDKIKRQAFSKRNYDKILSGLVENSPHRPSGRLKILTGNYLSALLPENIQNLPSGTLINVKISPSDNQWDLLEAIPTGY